MSSPSMPASTPYILLFRNTGAENYRHLSAEQQQALVGRFNSWFESLVSQGKATIGQPLEDAARIVAGPGGSRVVDGPFAEAKEAVGGFVTLQVSGLEEATEIARRHPALDFGMVIEVREMTAHCHLGVTTRGVSVAT